MPMISGWRRDHRPEEFCMASSLPGCYILLMFLCLVSSLFPGCARHHRLSAGDNKTVVQVSTIGVPESSAERPARHPGFSMHWGGRKVASCMDCHVDHTHRAVAGERGEGAGAQRCLSCHQGCGARQALSGGPPGGCLRPVRSSGPGPIPARPLLITACNLCHPKEYKEFSTYITMHSQFSCTTCHHVWHGVIPRCTQCHPRHGAGLNGIGCTKCHPPHMVLRIKFPARSPGNICIGCHRGAYEDLKEAGGRHRGLRCTTCHPGEHGTTKRCIQCHGDVHKRGKGGGIAPEYHMCTRCHGQAHVLIIHPMRSASP